MLSRKRPERFFELVLNGTPSYVSDPLCKEESRTSLPRELVMPRRTRHWSILALSSLLLLTQGAGALLAQAPNLGPLASPTGLGSLALSPGQLMGTPGSQKSTDDSI